MAEVELDFSDVEALALALARIGDDAESEGEKIVAKGALNIKKRAQELAPKGPHTPHYAQAISYDIRKKSGDIEAEIGPKRGRRQWGLGNLLEYGSVNNPPHPHHEPALDEEEPRFYEHAEKLAESLIDRIL